MQLLRQELASRLREKLEKITVISRCFALDAVSQGLMSSVLGQIAVLFINGVNLIFGSITKNIRQQFIVGSHSVGGCKDQRGIPSCDKPHQAGDLSA